MDLGSGGKGSSKKDEQSLANQKFDALLGIGAPEPKEENVNMEKMLQSSLAPVTEENVKSARK